MVVLAAFFCFFDFLLFFVRFRLRPFLRVKNFSCHSLESLGLFCGLDKGFLLRSNSWANYWLLNFCFLENKLFGFLEIFFNEQSLFHLPVVKKPERGIIAFSSLLLYNLESLDFCVARALMPLERAERSLPFIELLCQLAGSLVCSGLERAFSVSITLNFFASIFRKKLLESFFPRLFCSKILWCL